MALDQSHRQLAIHTPLGKDVVVLKAAAGKEYLSRLFEFELDLISEDHEIDFDKIAGQNATLQLEQSLGRTRYFNGFISHFAQSLPMGCYARYRATLVPWCWLLTQNKNSRIFQNQTVPDIILFLIKEWGFDSYCESRLTETYLTREYCVQYAESDFAFISRLMESEGIYYFFEHKEDKHTLVLADGSNAHSPLDGYDTIELHSGRQKTHERDVIREWTIERQLVPGRATRKTFDFKKPKSNIVGKTDIHRRSDPAATIETYEYRHYEHTNDGHNNDEAERKSKIDLERHHASYDTCRGEGDCRGLAAGATFELVGHRRASECREYLVTSVIHRMESDDFASSDKKPAKADTYLCHFTVQPASKPFRPLKITPRPSMTGPQTAIVVGKTDHPIQKEVMVDKHGRVRVHFHWDRHHDPEDMNSSCWIRATHPWAGKGFGGMAIPRVGQEVLVDFLDGNPDHPVINGRLYNEGSMPQASNAGRKTPGPTDLSQAAMMTSFKSNSLGGSGGSNEITMNDEGGKEGLFIKAQKDEIHNVGNDRSREVGNNETVKIGVNREKTVGTDEKESIGVNKTIDVGSNHTENIGSNMSLTVGKNQSINVGMMKNESVGLASAENIGAAKALSIGAAYQVSVGGLMNETVGGAKTEEVGMYRMEAVGGDKKVTIGGDLDVSTSGKYNDSATEITLTGKTKIVLQCGGSTITLEPALITIKGPLVKINC